MTNYSRIVNRKSSYNFDKYSKGSTERTSNELDDKYKQKLISLSRSIDLIFDCYGNREKMSNLLINFLEEKQYNITNPDDYSVQYNYSRKGFRRIVREGCAERIETYNIE